MATMLRHYVARRDNLPSLSDAELRAIERPMLVVGGDHDQIVDVPGTMARLRGLVPGVETQLIPGGGHAQLRTANRVIPFLVRDSSVERPDAAAMGRRLGSG
jgi:pimeloyl-ACP methyl ester carboxylesterase